MGHEYRELSNHQCYFPETITRAMSEVVASEQLKKAAENKGEAIKIQAVKAEAEKKERSSG